MQYKELELFANRVDFFLLTACRLHRRVFFIFIALPLSHGFANIYI